jgi:DNA replication and repair protein RecF
MLIKNINITSFRNFKSASAEFGPGVNVFHGRNGSGKTNLLEAIFVLLLGRSPRGAADTVLVKERAEVFRLEGEVEIAEKSYMLATGYQIRGRKRTTIDKVGIKGSELFGRCTAVSAAPLDMEIIFGAPAKRREFINIYLSQASARYLANLSDYQKALVQKNAFLKQEHGTTDNPYDDLLVKYGSIVTYDRHCFLEAIAKSAVVHYEKIAGGQKLGMAYAPSVRVEASQYDLAEVETSFKEKLGRYREREKILETALVGPHRDEIDFTIGGYPARTHGSQGELRTAAISLKLAVFEYLKEIRRETPILLLDEIFAELDDGRVEKLIESFGEFGQLFLTTASEVPEKLLVNSRRFRIEPGILKEE